MNIFERDRKNVISNADARLTEAEKTGMKTQHEFELILNEAANLRMEKVLQYGEERYDEKDIDVQLWMLYCDIWRKFSRLRKLIKNIIKNEDLKSVEKLRDDCLDLLNYGAMGAQIIDRLDLINKFNKKQ
jgi:hypothetical protein